MCIAKCVTGTAPLLLLCGLSAPASAQFIDNTADIPSGAPANNSWSENVDFGDVDLDGDWDAVFADGGDVGQDRNRLWVNQGGAQGGTVGVFIDRTKVQLPDVQDQSRDIELADIDGDADLDAYVANTSSIIDQPNRWWVNRGGSQGGTLGYYTDESAERWVDLAVGGSSVADQLVLDGGGFVDWTGDGDFADLDNDGDLDLFHSSYGPTFNGRVPSRVFLNDGQGYFREHNPSGLQLSQEHIQEGHRGLWCEGHQQDSTTASDGTFCDVAETPLDVDLGDIDGDFDLDVLLGSRDEDPRMFANRLDGSALAPAMPDGSLLFRDVTGAVFPEGYAPGVGHYEQEMGDLDGDGDLDIFGVDWDGSFVLGDVTLENLTGEGIFGKQVTLPLSTINDNEGDCFDYDGDGDLDLFVASFTGHDKLYRNENDGGTGFSFTPVTDSQLPDVSFITLDADAADVDGDGDYDLFAANIASARNVYYENQNDVPDTSAPYLPNLEQAPDRSAGPTPTVVRVHVYDNAPYYVTWYNETWLEYSVDGGPASTVPMRSSGGQVFRGEIPGELEGTVTYRAFSEDEHGNQGSSGERSFLAGPGCEEASFCSSTPNSTGRAAVIRSNGECSIAANRFTLFAGPVPNQFGVFFFSAAQAAGGSGVPFGNGLRCVGTPTDGIFRLDVVLAGQSELSDDLDFTRFPGRLVTPGSTWHFQAWFRDPAAGGAAFDLSDAISVTFRP